jgi:5-enolpyruvylshikimate-3-phosphate synthase
MRQTIRPARRLSGGIVLPGDKSISHRYAMIASLADGTSRIQNYSPALTGSRGRHYSGSTIRMMSGLLAAQPLGSTIFGPAFLAQQVFQIWSVQQP